MLEMHGISKRFGATQALDGVDFAAEAGEVHALLGANGAGKSTLMKVLGGLYPDAAGSIRLDGRDVRLETPRAALAAGVGMVYQEFDLAPDLSVAENIMLGRERLRRLGPTRWLSRRQLTGDAQALVEEHGFGLPVDKTVSALPVGARQLTQVAKVLALDSRVVVLDEPTARLTAGERDDLFAAMRRLTASGKAVIFISHYLEEVLAIADRVTVLRDGRKVTERPARELDTDELSRLMVGQAVHVAEAAAATSESRSPGAEVLVVKGLSRPPGFDDVSFEVRAGEVVGLTGIIGSGRHEVTRAIVGQLPAAGTVELKGHVLRRRAPHHVIAAGVGFVPEDRRLEGIVPDRTIRENVCLGSLPASSRAGLLDAAGMRERTRGVIERLAVKCSGPEQPVWQLSGGNQQKVLLGRWLATRASAIVLESPTVGVDVLASQEIHQHIRELAAEGRALLVSSDDLDELKAVADRILVMVRGRIVRSYPPSMAREELLGALGGAAPRAEAA